MLMDELDALFAYWAKFPPVHEAIRLGLIGWGIMKPSETDQPKPVVTDEDVATAAALREKWGTA